MRKPVRPESERVRGPAVTYAYVGCFTTAKRRCHGDGIHVYRMTTPAGTWTQVQHLADWVNPSFFIVNRNQSVLYAVHGDETYATSFVIDPRSGHLAPLNKVETGGRNGVRLVLDPAERFAIIANYGSGSLSVHPLAENGALGQRSQLLALPGTPHFRARTVQQDSAHPHDVQFDPSGHFVVVPDKGLDRVFVLRFDAAKGRLTLIGQNTPTTRAGAGPRHVAFHPKRPYAWVVNELDSTVSTFRFDNTKGTLAPLDVVSTLPGNFTGNSTGAEIAFVAATHTLYVSNRGHDSIAMFRVDPRNGLPKPIGWTPSGGRNPRFFALDPELRFLLSANEQGDTIVPLRIADDGRLRRAGRIIPSLSPVTIAFVGLLLPGCSRASGDEACPPCHPEIIGADA